MTFKCPDCGATIRDDSRFCNYCGAKIDDGVQRSEVNVNINQRIEDVAEVKRAELATKAFEHEAAKELKKTKAVKTSFWIKLALFVISWAGTLLVQSSVKFAFVIAAAAVTIYIVVEWINKVTK